MFSRFLRIIQLTIIIILRRFNIKIPGRHLEYTGPLSSWSEAKELSTGYDSEVVLDKVAEATKKVILGEAEYERDGTTFSKKPRKDTLRALLTKMVKQDQLIIDFGGGLGGTFICNRDVFVGNNLKYIVVEQESFVTKGTELAKYFDLPIQYATKMPSLHSPSIVILSGVIQYLENWAEIIDDIISKSPEYIIVDRTPLEKTSSKIFVQENPGYYQPKVSYPARHLSRVEFLTAFHGFTLIKEWKSDFDPANHRGFLFSLDK